MKKKDDDNNIIDDDDDDDDDNKIIMALKRAIQDFRRSPLTVPRTVTNTYAQVARAQSCANHVQDIERFSRATCSEPLGTAGQLSYKV